LSTETPQPHAPQQDNDRPSVTEDTMLEAVQQMATEEGMDYETLLAIQRSLM
jgi:hypothetical protein